MTARRTRSLSELPGHLRVPILRRKDTQRTKDRLAAGIAGMEELRSLRQHQQQIVGETVAKAEDKRQERRQGGDRVILDDESSFLNCSSLSSVQTLLSPRHPVPHPRAFFRGQSMDSILEEGDGMTSGHRGETIGTRHHPNVDDNNNTKNNININDDFNKPQPPQFSQDGLELRSSAHQLSPSHTPRTASVSQKHNHQTCENETRYHSVPQTQSEDNPTPNPSLCCDGNDTSVLQKHRGQMEDTMTYADAPTPTRRRSLSSRPCNECPMVSPRQRSMSLDMGQSTIQSTPMLLCQPHVSKTGHLHNRFSSLTSINSAGGSDKIDFPDTMNLMSTEDGYRLSQSMTQINDAGNNNRLSTTLKRRGSLTWDSLLKSIGIDNSSGTDLQNQSPGETKGDENDDTEKENDNSEHIEQKILMNRKKGRSMSFTCGSPTPLINPTNYRMNSTRQNPVVADHNLGVLINKKSSLESSSPPPKSIHPILRRASIQCEAVLTNCSRVVNPIQDVDVARFNSPGPLHAVMLQYRGYNPGNVRADADKAITKPNKHITQVSDTQKLSNGCLSARTNTAKHSLSHPVKNSSDLASQFRLTERGEISPGLATSDTQDQMCCNITQEVKNDLSVLAEENDKSSTTEECHNSVNGLNEDANKHANVNADISKTRVKPDFANESENSLSKTSLGAMKCESITVRDTLHHSLSVVNKHDHQWSHVEMSSTSIDSRHSGSAISHERKEHHENSAELANLSMLSKSNTIKTNTRDKVDGDKSVSMKVLDSKSAQISEEKEINTSELVNGIDEDRNVFHCGKSNGDDCLLNAMYAHSANPRYHNEQEPCNDITGNRHSPHTSVSEVHDNDGKLFQSMSQSHFGQHNMDEADIIRDKRSSIFSDVSLISDLSSKTPSSSASVFSDVSMVSDEGYNTCESTSPDNKLLHLKRLSSVSSSHTTTPYPHVSSGECLSNFVFKHSTQRDKNGNNINIKNNGMSSEKLENQNNGHFCYEKEIALDRAAPVAHVKPIQRQTSNLNSNQHAVCRKPSKQTTV